MAAMAGRPVAMEAYFQEALAQADERKLEAQERLRKFEADAESEEADLTARLRAAQANIRAIRAQRQVVAPAFIPQDLRTKKVLSELREAESERDAMMRAASTLQNELAQARAHQPQNLALDAMEHSLRSEAAALRSALAFCERRHEDSHRTQAREAEALRRQLEAQHEEKLELDAAEERLRIGRACVADALALRRPHMVDDSCSPEALRDAALQVEVREEACRRAQASLEELHEECGHLLRLNGAAEAKVQDLEQRLAFGGLQATIIRALDMLRRHDEESRRPGSAVKELKGAARLVLVLAQICGVPRMAFLALDSNRSGRVSMCEFDSGLRLRFGLDYEAIAQMEKPVLRPLFKEFDARKKGFLAEEDFARCCPEIWAAYGKAPLGSSHGPPGRSLALADTRSEDSNASSRRALSTPQRGRR